MADDNKIRTSGTCKRNEVKDGECFYFVSNTDKLYHQVGYDQIYNPNSLPPMAPNWTYVFCETVSDRQVVLIPSPRISGTCKRNEVRDGECFYFIAEPEEKFCQISPQQYINLFNGASDFPDLPDGWEYTDRYPFSDHTVVLVSFLDSQNEEMKQKVEEKYPHKCPRCGNPSYNGFISVECSANC